MADEQTKPKMDLDETVNVEMDPEDALRLLLGEERREDDTSATPHKDSKGGYQPV